MVETIAVRRSRFWISHFTHSAAHPPEIDFSKSGHISPLEKGIITSSIQKFQLGEGSDGYHLIVAAARYGEQFNDPDYLIAIRLFIKEEQRHSADLGRFMEYEEIPRIHSTYTDWIFRRVRRFGSSLEGMLRTLLVAETIALVYYTALRDATGSKVLKQICERILEDEAHHLQFQTERLAILSRYRSRLRNLFATCAHIGLYTGAVGVVWLDHRKVFRAGGYDLNRYLRSCFHEFAEVLAAIERQQRAQRQFSLLRQTR